MYNRLLVPGEKVSEDGVDTQKIWSLHAKNRNSYSNPRFVAMSCSRITGVPIVMGICLLPCFMYVDVSSWSSMFPFVLGPQNRLKLASQSERESVLVAYLLRSSSCARARSSRKRSPH